MHHDVDDFARSPVNRSDAEDEEDEEDYGDGEAAAPTDAEVAATLVHFDEQWHRA